MASHYIHNRFVTRLDLYESNPRVLNLLPSKLHHVCPDCGIQFNSKRGLIFIICGGLIIIMYVCRYVCMYVGMHVCMFVEKLLLYLSDPET